VEEADAVARALAWYGEGLDFAHALHLASSHRAVAFATFDRTLQRRATKFADAPAVIVP
jgi:hypothetical protein